MASLCSSPRSQLSADEGENFGGSSKSGDSGGFLSQQNGFEIEQKKFPSDHLVGREHSQGSNRGHPSNVQNLSTHPTMPNCAAENECEHSARGEDESRLISSSSAQSRTSNYLKPLFVPTNSKGSMGSFGYSGGEGGNFPKKIEVARHRRIDELRQPKLTEVKQKAEMLEEIRKQAQSSRSTEPKPTVHHLTAPLAIMTPAKIASSAGAKSKGEKLPNFEFPMTDFSPLRKQFEEALSAEKEINARQSEDCPAKYSYLHDSWE